MPIEIRELVIKVTVLDESESAVGQRPQQAVGLTEDDLRHLRQELTQTCVRQVLAELERRRGR